MQIFLLWRHRGQMTKPLGVNEVAARLQRKFSPLFDKPLRVTIRRTAAANLVVLDLPVEGWKSPFIQSDDETWSLAGDYPINARVALGSGSMGIADDRLLPVLCRKLQQNPEPLINNINPPFSLFWSAKQSEDFYIQNDALGYAQLFEYCDERIWAVSNKIFAFPELGLPLKAVPEQWATRLTIGWFPLSMSGYESISYLPPATQLRVGIDGVHRNSFDVLSSWVNPDPMSTEECMELAQTSLLDFVENVDPLWERASAGLSGGWDSRVIAACLRASGSDAYFRVRGLPERFDVILARQLADKAGFKLKVSTGGGLPLDSSGGCRRSIYNSLIWQAGYLTTRKHCSFLAKKQYLAGGAVNFMGAHGAIAKPYYAEKIGAQFLQAGQYEEQLVEQQMQYMPSYMRGEFRDRVRHIIVKAYRQADQYELKGLTRLTFFYLYERTRRWASGSSNAQTSVVVSPFLNRDFIRAVFALPGHDLTGNPFHCHMIDSLAPEWSNITYTGQLEQEAADKLLSTPSPAPNGLRDWKQPVGNEKFDTVGYWDQVARPLITEGLKTGGFWTQLFDPDLASEHWREAPDELAIALMLSQLLDEEPV